ncbi:MAG: Lrp/AsnC family transcriptional regulator [Gammaproteobacteria bacterium]|nr:Lrp/AsnC family transcriptional regulator [Gammaproteobacteria bacterium]
MTLSPLERSFINRYQGDFPLQTRPFLTVAEQLGSSEDSLLATVKTLLEKKILSRFGPLYDAVNLGGGLTLAALSVPQEHYAIVTELVNAFPEVAHNYRREHELNMWFVLATETPAQIERALLSIQQTTKLKVYNFPKLQEFYIGLWLQLAEDNTVTTVPVPNRLMPTDSRYRLDEVDRKIVSVTQSGLPLNISPYQTVAFNIGIGEDEVLQRMQRLLDNNIIRRIGVVPNHYRLGLHANGMTVWDIDEDKIEMLGELIGQLDFVSHCYHRPRHSPLWSYNLFAMVHGHDRDAVEQKVNQIKTLLAENYTQHETLYSTAILKKTGMRLAA